MCSKILESTGGVLIGRQLKITFFGRRTRFANFSSIGNPLIFLALLKLFVRYYEYLLILILIIFVGILSHQSLPFESKCLYDFVVSKKLNLLDVIEDLIFKILGFIYFALAAATGSFALTEEVVYF